MTHRKRGIIILRKAALFLTVIVIIFTYRCSLNIAGGVSEETNSRIGGIVMDSTGHPIPGAVVTFRQIIITVNGDSVLYEKQVTTNDTGKFGIDSIPDGKYIISYSNDTLSAILSKVTLLQGDSIKDLMLALSSSIHIIGRIIDNPDINYEDVTVFIPGLDNKAYINCYGFYILHNVPVGQYDISFIHDGIINYLPVLITRPGNDTAFIKEVMLQTDSNAVAVPYSYFPCSEVTGYSVIPIEYKPTNEPWWYPGHNFTNVTYYRGTNETLHDYTPSVNQILFMANYKKGLKEDDEALVKHLRQNAYTVLVVDDNEVSINDSTGIDLVYISYSIEYATAGALFKKAAIPLITCDGNSYINLKMVAPQGSGIGYSENAIQITDLNHPISEEFKDTVVILNGLGTFSFGRPFSSADKIAVNPLDSTNVYIFAYETGDALYGIYAPARRIGFLANEGVGRRFNDNGWKIFDAMINWALGGK